METILNFFKNAQFSNVEDGVVELLKSWNSLTCIQKIICIGSAMTVVLGPKLLLSVYMRRKLTGKRTKKQQERKEAIDKLRNRLLQLEKVGKLMYAEDIVNLPFQELQQQLQRGHLTPLQVLYAYQQKALEAQERTNCLVEPINEAESWAKQLLYVAAEDRGPLHGIPVSVKENLPLKGYDCTEGCSHLIDQPFYEDCVIVQVLKSQGAIPFMRTNMPQLGGCHESSNPIFGRTTHPLSASLCPGGSSSGEAALIGCGGSVLGFGSDTGGSIRCPAALTGLCAIKPTYSRSSPHPSHYLVFLLEVVNSIKGRPDINGQTIMQSVSSPMSRDMYGLVTALRCLYSPHLFSRDHTVAPLPFREQLFQDTRPLKIGMCFDDFVCEAYPSYERALIKVKLKLEQRGHTVLPWTPPAALGSYLWAIAAQCADAGESTIHQLRHDRVDPCIAQSYYIYMMPMVIKRFLQMLFRLTNPYISSMINTVCGIESVSKWWSMTKDIMNYRFRVADELKMKGIDAVITPAFGCPALPYGSSEELLFCSSYQMLFNLLDFPAGTVPVTIVLPQDLAQADYPSKPHAQQHKNIYNKIKKKVSSYIDHSLPVGVQVASLPYQEEICLRLMAEIEEMVNQEKKVTFE